MADKTMIVKKDDMHKLAETVKSMAQGANTLMAQAGQMADIIVDHRAKLDAYRQKQGSALTKLEIMLGVNQLARKDVMDGKVYDFLGVQEKRIAEIIDILKAEVKS